MDAKVVIEACKAATALMKFVTGGGLREAILTVNADAHIRAAAYALENVSGSKDPRSEVRLAVGHLQAAHVAYEVIWHKAFRTVFGGTTSIISARLTAHSDTEACWLMAACYVFLGEKQSAERALKLARDAHDGAYSHDTISILKVFTSVLNPREVIAHEQRRSSPNWEVGAAIEAAVERMP